MTDVDTSIGNPGTDDPTKQPATAPTPDGGDSAKLLAEIARKEELLKKTQAKLAKMEADDKKRTDDLLAQQGEFKTLAEQRQATIDELTKKVTDYETWKQGIIDQKTKELETMTKPLTDDQKALVSLGKDLDAQIKLAKTFAQTKPNPPDPNNPGRGQTQTDINAIIKDRSKSTMDLIKAL